MNSYFVEASTVRPELDAWVVATYPDVQIERSDCLALSSHARSEAELRLILTAAIVNEHSLRDGDAHRAAIMDLLLG